jgi:hypothetical protein
MHIFVMFSVYEWMHGKFIDLMNISYIISVPKKGNLNRRELQIWWKTGKQFSVLGLGKNFGSPCNV